MFKLSNIYSDEDRTIEILGKKFPWPFPISCMVHSSSAIVFGRKVYGGGKDDKRPITGFLHKVFSSISDFKYGLMYRLIPYHKYHVIYTDLGYGYHCSDKRILWGNMKCLEDYIKASKHDGEKGLEEHINDMRNAPEGMIDSCVNRDSEALKIYRWWKYERPANIKRREQLLHILYSGKDRVTFVDDEEYPGCSKYVFKKFEGDEITQEVEMRALEKKIDDDEQSYLHRLINIRQSLWI